MLSFLFYKSLKSGLRIAFYIIAKAGEEVKTNGEENWQIKRNI